MTVSGSLRRPHKPNHRRQTGGKRPTTSKQQPTRNDSKHQGQRRSRRIAAGQEMAMLAFTRQRSPVILLSILVAIRGKS